MIRCPYGENRRIPQGCHTCNHHDKQAGCLKTASAKKKPQEATIP